MYTILLTLTAVVMTALLVFEVFHRKREANLRRQLAAKAEVIAVQKAGLVDLLRQRNELVKLVKQREKEPFLNLASSFVDLQEAQKEKREQQTDSGVEVDVDRFRGL